MIDSPFRIATIGESSVGKTSIIRIVSGDKFDATESTTAGVDFGQIIKKVDGKTATLEIWDTAGQERFRSLVPVYCRNVNAALAVFDISAPESFAKLGSWIELFKSLGDDRRLVFIVANKLDLLNENSVDLEKAKEWAQERNYMFFQVSAKTGQGLDEMIQAVIHSLFEAFPGHNDISGIQVEYDAEKKKKNCSC
ncbi:small GTP-binding protein, putative [Trichomonas vaginalis G3]|uniref:Small GTP-binding protein, putative n=1 Tax=Trichomonas vaginalis (strain ATCC PRA-98 / G3) TaxID=412133 RepID=A2EX52_TRIV3|nr:retrograde vesicle-mediated transport, Golgi to ER [Trichomonas vaginalis G3]EAY02772.1 small GTP-binding protein, putative [Trichomonas vaginalis G3]KAI5500606.1 retrograde vesicle-mediated transport, Golgi to ER [Trichomonas vaginalis G3]|eukprot:XP_001314995.1 small GTP-binding protein [Trichomonas vaginalis G3]